MKIFWIMCGFMGLFRIISALCAHFDYNPKVVTIVGNCAIPILAALMVALINHMKRQLAILSEEEE